MKKYLLIVLLFALCLQLLMLQYTPIYPLQSDALYYFSLGKNVAEGKGFQFNGELPTISAPLYPLFLALIFKIFGAGQMQAYYSQIVLNLFSILLMFILGKLLVDEKVGLLSSFLYSIHPSTSVYVRTMLTETLMVFLVISFFVLFFLAKKKENLWLFLLAGLVGLLASMTRWVFAFFPGICFIWILFYYRNNTKKALRFAFAFIAIYIVLSIPYLIHSGKSPFTTAKALVTKNLFIKKSFVKDAWSLWGGIVQKEVIYRDKDNVYYTYSPIHKHINDIFYKYIVTIVSNTKDKEYNLNYTLHKFILFTIFLSFFFVKFVKKYLFLYLFLLYWTIMHVLLYSIPRYQFGAVPILLIVFSIFCFYIVDFIKEKRKHTINATE